MNTVLKSLCISFLISSLPLHVEAHQPYHAKVIVDAVSETVSAPNLVDLKRELSTASLEELIPLYTPASPVAFDINLRGLIANTSFAANSTVLVVTIPDAGITEVFDGGTRDQSLTLFKDFLKEGTKLSKLLKAYAKYSPIDPVAGNPNSLMAQMGQADYLLGNLSPLSGCCCRWDAQPVIHQFQLGTYVGRAFSENFETTIVTLPLRYSYSPTGWSALIIDAPFTYIKNGGASSVFGSLGIGFRFPIGTHWSLTPTVRGGGGGSLDLACSGSFVSAGLVSVYNYKLCDTLFSLTNYAGYITSTNLWLTGVNFNYHLQDYVFKNGLTITSCKGFTFCGKEVHFKVAIEDTCFTGERLFIRHFDEVSLALITTRINPWVGYDSVTVGIAYQFGQKNYKGYCFNFAYQF